MREHEPSRTAFGAAMFRALHQDHDEDRIFTDPLAWTILGDRGQLVADLGEGYAQSRLRVFIAVRHRFAEDSLAAAYARGTRQAVVLGAGFDTFAYRNPHPELLVWEVDHPATRAWKRDRLAEAGIAVPDTVRFVGVDFERESFLDRLVGAGLDADAPTFLLWLGVVPYLTRAATEATLREIASIRGGEVVFDVPALAEEVSEKARQDRADLEARVAELGEPFVGGWEPAELLALLASLGFDEVEDLDRSEIRTRYLALAADDRPGGAHVVRARVSS